MRSLSINFAAARNVTVVKILLSPGTSRAKSLGLLTIRTVTDRPACVSPLGPGRHRRHPTHGGGKTEWAGVLAGQHRHGVCTKQGC